MRGMKTSPVLALCALLAALLAAACCRVDGGKVAAPAPRAAELHDVVFISIDTQRVDRLGVYGYAQKTSPNLDALAKEAVVFDDHHAQAPITLPSHTSMLTGLDPQHHGVRTNGAFRLGPSAFTLAEALKAQGYATGAVVSAGVLNPEFGLDQGFDAYSGDFSEASSKAYSDATSATDRAIAWADSVPSSSRMFLFVHYYDPHIDNGAPPRFSFTDPYDAEVAYADEQIGRLLDHLKQKGRAGDALIVVTADHGQSLGEHGLTGHTHVLYEQTLHVPLIVRFPGGAHGGTRVASLTRSVDLMPTILSFLGVRTEVAFNGVDLLPAAIGGAPPEIRESYAETLFAPVPQLHEKSIISGGRKLISLYLLPDGFSVADAIEMIGAKRLRALPNLQGNIDNYTNLLAGLPNGRGLFDLAADPKEEKNLYTAEPKLASELEAALARQKGPLPGEPYIPDSTLATQLRNLGYVQ